MKDTEDSININDDIYALLKRANFGEMVAIANLAIATLETFAIEHTQTTLLPHCSELVKKANEYLRLITYQEKIDLATEILSRISQNDEDDKDDEYITALKQEMPLTVGETEGIREFLGC